MKLPVLLLLCGTVIGVYSRRWSKATKLRNDLVLACTDDPHTNCQVSTTLDTNHGNYGWHSIVRKLVDFALAATCSDRPRANCAKYQQKCGNDFWKSWLTKYCSKTCGFCTSKLPACSDHPRANCVKYQRNCGKGFWKSWLTKYCSKTCGFCTSTVSPTQLPTKLPTEPPTKLPTEPPTSPACGVKGRTHTRIVGGNLSSPGDWPWQVTYDWKKNTGNPGHWCGASILSPYWILTAAHCFGYSKNPEDYNLTVGDFEIRQHEGNEQRIKIKKILTHEKYNSLTYDYDIALIKLSNPVKYTERVRPVCLPPDDMNFQARANCYVTGWGKLHETGTFPTQLYQAKVPLIDWQECASTYQKNHGYVITERMICAGFVNGGIDACQGDSGGPLVCDRGGQWYLVGAVSWGIGCARRSAYGVYADVANLKPWVLKNMNSN